MKGSEFLARIIVVTGVLASIGPTLYFWGRTPLIHARTTENGGWNPDVLYGKVGEPLVLHLTSDDVTLGFAVAGMPMQSVDVLPGKVTVLTLNFDKPGEYTFYCTRGCGINHTGMTGTITVSAPDSDPAASNHLPLDSTPPPLYGTLGIDLDEPHNSPITPVGRPSSIVGQSNEVPIFPILPSNNLPIYQSPEFYRSHSPYETWQILRANPAVSNMDDQQIWNMVAFIWQSNASPEAIDDGRKLFAQNCAACHGETAQGNGVFADDLKAAEATAAQTAAGIKSINIQGPADFTDAIRMLGASPALLQGKILRGGIGTGMPSWGTIFTQDQTWDLVAYLYSFQFEYR